jgi:hypothetical protein
MLVYNGKRIEGVVNPVDLLKGQLKKMKSNSFGNEFNPSKNWNTYTSNKMTTFFNGDGFRIPPSHYSNVENIYGYGNAENGEKFYSLGLNGPQMAPRPPIPNGDRGTFDTLLFNSFGKKRRSKKRVRKQVRKHKRKSLLN